jgi:hypothetical protein
MEKEFGINDFNKFIQNVKYNQSYITYDANIIRIEFIDGNDKRIYFFVINPPWRIISNNKIVANSNDYPFHEKHTRNEQENWWSKTNFIKHEKIAKIYLLANCDLIIEWNNGAMLNKFVDEIEYPSYFFYDNVDEKTYDFYYKKIIQDDWKSKNK